MKTRAITVEIAVAWWFRWYVATLTLVAALMSAEPDPEKLARVLLKAIRVRVVR
ncbi:hypothetical protein [Luteibacter sp.]|uniref:hypothetical protein n=1 Tax=Luteibacter sp. TaxID=1886636 RepID=UPI0025BFDE5C|nr:hypothetical protein [Luteibacter sp.]